MEVPLVLHGVVNIVNLVTESVLPILSHPPQAFLQLPPFLPVPRQRQRGLRCCQTHRSQSPRMDNVVSNMAQDVRTIIVALMEGIVKMMVEQRAWTGADRPIVKLGMANVLQHHLPSISNRHISRATLPTRFPFATRRTFVSTSACHTFQTIGSPTPIIRAAIGPSLPI
jgi:hypothetical protein